MTRQRGFTLMEMLIAVVILGTAVAAIASVITTSMRNVSRAEEYERVTLLARSQMNELQTLPWRDGQTWSGNWSDGYHWSAAATVIPGDPTQDSNGYQLMRMTLVGAWSTARGQKTYTLETARLQQRPN